MTELQLIRNLSNTQKETRMWNNQSFDFYIFFFRLVGDWCFSVQNVTRKVNQIWAARVEDHPGRLLCLWHQASHHEQKWNINSSHTCALMTSCPFKHKMTTSVLSPAPRSRQSKWSPASFSVDMSLFIFTETRGLTFFFFSEGCHHDVITLELHCDTKLKSILSLSYLTR